MNDVLKLECSMLLVCLNTEWLDSQADNAMDRFVMLNISKAFFGPESKVRVDRT